MKEYTKKAYIGITLFTNQGKSNYFSMANRFFDYMHACVPQLCVNYPEYQKVNEQFEISYLVNNCETKTISTALNEMLENEALHSRLKQNCLNAREVYCWQEEEKRLINIYKNVI